MESLKKALKNYWVLSAFCVVMGGALIYDPNFFTKLVGMIVGGLIALYGVISLVRYFIKAKEDPTNAFGLVTGVISCAAGVFIMVRPDFIPKVIAVLFGCYMLISGIINVQEALYIKGRGDSNWLRGFLPALLTALVGILLLINPLVLANTTLRVLGVCLLISGIMNIGGSFSIGRSVFRRAKEAKQEEAAEVKEEDFVDIE